MFISEAALEKRLNSDGNLINQLGNLDEVAIERRKRFNGGGDNQVIDNDKKVLIGTLAKLKKHETVAAEFGVSMRTVERLGNGVSGEGYEKRPELVAAIEENVKSAKETIKTKALDRLMGALDIVGARMSNGLQDTETKDVAGIAKDMATIVHKLEGGDRNINQNPAGLILIVPNVKKISQFEVVDVPA